MLYHLLYPLSAEYTFFNIFRYITFRSAGAFITALLLAIILGPAFIRWLQKLNCRQNIHDCVVAHQSKQGTPTMGGLLIMASFLIALLLWGDLTNSYVWLSLFVYVTFAGIGFIDDYQKINKHTNKGLSARGKFLLQLIASGIAIVLLVMEPAYSTKLVFPFFKNINPDLGLWYIPFAMLVIVGASNAVNLTDGLDGLAIGPFVVATIVFSIFIYVTGHFRFAVYLQVPYIPQVGEVTVFCSALVGAGLGFLWYNAYPAQVFMGDVGSLGLGGVLGFLAVVCKQELLLVIVGGLFVLETLSVILQVGYFKLSGGKRIFRMAPLHHHFEMKGIPESKVIIRFWIVSVLFGLIALTSLKLR